MHYQVNQSQFSQNVNKLSKLKRQLQMVHNKSYKCKIPQCVTTARDEYALTTILIIDDKSITSDFLEPLPATISLENFHNCNNCEFYNVYAYLGHVITPNGIKPNPDKVKTIQHFPIPKTTKSIKAFFGLLRYYRKFMS